MSIKKYAMAGGLFSLLFIAGCSSEHERAKMAEFEAQMRSEWESGPSDTLVEIMVEQAVWDHPIPKKWLNSAHNGRKEARITKIEVVERGPINKKQKFWPIRVKVVGIAKLDSMHPPGASKDINFDALTDVKYSVTGFKWYITYEGHEPAKMEW
ncbi:hypothetical protein N9J88_04065 [Porticoccaceae bacterium]|nr:hypothetical protein [Porticoccaceae bacterium]